MTSPSKKVCIVQLSFDCDSSDSVIFTKKVRICGFPMSIENPSTAYVKEINYPHPHNLKRVPHHNRSASLQFANLSYPRIDLDLANSLDKFDYIVVNNSESAELYSDVYIMNTVEIENILENVKYFRGVYPADKLPTLVSAIYRKHRNQPSCFISNTQGSREPGEHWVAFYIPASKNQRSTPIEFFDSFGFHNRLSFLHTNHFANFVRRLEKETRKPTIEIRINADRLQDDSSTLCGYYCIVYVFFRCQLNMRMTQILHRLHTPGRTDYKRNDNNVMQIFRKVRSKSMKTTQSGGKMRMNRIIQKCVPLRKCMNQ